MCHELSAMDPIGNRGAPRQRVSRWGIPQKNTSFTAMLRESGVRGRTHCSSLSVCASRANTDPPGSSRTDAYRWGSPVVVVGCRVVGEECRRWLAMLGLFGKLSLERRLSAARTWEGALVQGSPQGRFVAFGGSLRRPMIP